MEKVKEKILELLQNCEEMFTSEIAKKLKISTTTASKYLGILEAEGKIECHTVTPYKYWRIKKDNKRNRGDKSG